MTRAIEILSQARLDKTSSILRTLATIDAIKSKLIELFPQINSGRKNVDDLISELLLGECILSQENGTILRIVRVASVEIPCPLDDGRRLWEIRQEYPTSVVERNLPGLSEKIQGEESPRTAAIRGIKEELGISEPLKVRYLSSKITDNPQSAYEGIVSKTDLHQFIAFIKLSDFREEYYEIQQSKTTIFGWR